MMNDELTERTDLKARTKRFALRILKLSAALPRTTEAQILGKQLIRSGTSVGAHYREATRARSEAEFISKLGGALQEIEETAYWLELLVDGGIMPETRLKDLIKETDELTAILVASSKTAKSRSGKRMKT
jgi:four helix bundle protein